MTHPTFNVGEINIVCSSLTRSLAFYRDLLGFDVLSEEQGCWHLACQGVPFLLLPFAAAPTRSVKPVEYGSTPTISVDLVVDDLAAAKKYLQANGVEIVEQPEDAGCFFVRDPDGLVLEIVQAQS